MKKERTIKMALVQMRSVQGDTVNNLSKAVEYISQAAEKGVDIVCFPELFYSGYHLSSLELQSLAEPTDGPMVQKLSKVAKEKNVYIIAGFAESTEIIGRMYNSAVLINNSGEVVGSTRKVYAWGNEKIKFKEGDKFQVFDTPLGKIGIMICYDMEFPEPMRIMALKGAEIVFVPSVWSFEAERRWHVDLAGGALYNLMYTAGINPWGDGACGSTMVVGPDGEVIDMAPREEEHVLYCEVNLNRIIEMRSKIPYLNDFKEDTFSMDAIHKY